MKKVIGAAVIAGTGIAIGVIWWMYKEWSLIRNSLGHEWNPLPQNIQLAIDDIGGNPGWVSLPAKHFDLSEPILTPNYLDLYGKGINRTVLRLADGSDCNVIMNADQRNGNTGIRLAGFTIDGNGLNQTYQPTTRHIQFKNHGIYFKKVDNTTIYNIQILHPSCCGIYWWWGNNNLVQNSEFGYCGEILEGTGTIDPQPSGIWADNQIGTVFRNLLAHDAYSGGLKFETHWEEPWNPDHFSNNCMMENCKCWNGFSGIWIERAQNIILQNCECFDNTKSEAYSDFPGGTGFVIGYRSRNIHNFNCKSYRNTWRGFSSNAKYNTIYDNCWAWENNLIMQSPKGGGFGLLRGDCPEFPDPIGYHLVLNCMSYNNGGCGIYYWTRNPTILHNIIDNVSRYGIYTSDDEPATNEGGEIAYNTLSNIGVPPPIKNILANVNIHDNTTLFEGHDTMIKVGDTLYDPTEANLQIAINRLGGSEGTVWLPRLTPITIQNNRLAVAENCRLRGAYGESVLDLLKGIDIQNANNVEISGFKIEGYEGIKIISNTNVSHFVLENIDAYDLSQTSAAPPGLFAIWAQDCTISDITMRNLHAERINCMMVHLSGGGTTDKIKDILIEDCYAKTCGYGIGRNWTTCYDLAEGITYLENMLVRRCHAEDGWENGFHWENLPTKTNVVIEDCTGVNNGWRKPDVSFGSGFWVSGGVTVRNCTSRGNKVRGYTFNNNKIGAETNITNCMDDGSTVGIKGEGTGGDTYITNFETKNNPDFGFYILLAQNIHISNMRLDNSGGAGGSYNNLFGSSSYPVTDSELDVIIVNDPVNTQSILVRNGVNLHFTGSIKTNSERGIMISTGTNILVEMDIDSTGNSGIRGYGTLIDVYVKNSLIENTEGTPSLEYGIYNGGTQLFVESSTVTVRDALVDYYNCTFV